MDPTALNNMSQIPSFPQFRDEHKIYLKTRHHPEKKSRMKFMESWLTI